MSMEEIRNRLDDMAEKTKEIIAPGACGVLPVLKNCSEDLCVKLATQEVDGKNE